MNLVQMYVKPAKGVWWTSQYRTITPSLNERSVRLIHRIRKWTQTLGGKLWNVETHYNTREIEAASLYDMATELSILPEDGIKRYIIEFWGDHIVIKAYTSILHNVWAEFKLHPVVG